MPIRVNQTNNNNKKGEKQKTTTTNEKQFLNKLILQKIPPNNVYT